MAPERESSSSSQNSSLLHVLRYILLGAFGIWVFSKLRTPIEYSDESNYPQDSTSDTTYVRQNLASPPLRVAIDSVPPPNPPTDEEKAEKEQDRKDKRFKTKLELGATLIALGLLAANLYQGYQTKKSADAAMKAANIAHDALVKQQRPWLGIDGYPIITEPVKLSIENGEERADMAVLVSVKNFGTAPALHMQLDIINEDTPTKSIPEWQSSLKREMENTCKFAEMSVHPQTEGALDSTGHVIQMPGNYYGPYIFPGTAPFQQLWRIGMPQLKHRTGQIRLIGCVVYNDQFREQLHHSTFCFRSDEPVRLAGPQTKFVVCSINQYAD